MYFLVTVSNLESDVLFVNLSLVGLQLVNNSDMSKNGLFCKIDECFSNFLVDINCNSFGLANISHNIHTYGLPILWSAWIKRSEILLLIRFWTSIEISLSMSGIPIFL